MTVPTPQQIKKTLVAAGLEVFRTRPEEVVVAERVRENLILDSGIRVRASEPMEVRVVLKAEQAAFPGEADDQLFARARALAEALGGGFAEVGTHIETVSDPGGSQRTLDTVYEVTFAKSVDDVDAAIAVTRDLLTRERVATK